MLGSPEQKIDELMKTIRDWQGGAMGPVRGAVPPQARQAREKLKKLLKGLSPRQRGACPQRGWTEFIEWYNTVDFGYYDNLTVMRALTEAMTDPACLERVACIRSGRDDICAAAIGALAAQGARDSLQRVFESYAALSPLDYYGHGAFAGPDFRGGASLWLLLGSLEDAPLAAALRRRGSAPQWADPDRRERFRGCWFSDGTPQRAEQIMERYAARLERLEQQGLLAPGEKEQFL